MPGWLVATLVFLAFLALMAGVGLVAGAWA